MDRNFCFSTVKNDIKSAADKFKAGMAPECASMCEYDVYAVNRAILKSCGAEIEEPKKEEENTFAGITIAFGAKVVLHPSFGTTFEEIKSHIKGKLKISS